MSNSKPRSIVYIDGYNWYHAIFKHYPEWKWLNVQSLFEALRPDEEVQTIKLFTAIVDEEKPNSLARIRQKTYISALETLPKIRIILGKFQDREVTCRAKCGLKYNVPEEKKTDVNIAVEIMADTFRNHCDRIIVVSGDSDVQPPVQWVKNNYSDKKITVYIPALPAERPNRRLDFYYRFGIECKFFPLDGLSHHQLPEFVRLGGGNVASRPSEWRKQP